MKILSTLLLLAPLAAQTVFTVPQGYTKINIPAAPSGTQSSLTVFSATLLTDAQYSGAVTVANDYDSDPDSDPETPESAQTLTVTGTTWTVNQWTGSPHLAYLVNSSGSEEAFLITSHGTDTLTVDAPFDLLADTRFPASTTVKIRPANTVGAILGEGGAIPFSSMDRVFIWSGSSWQTIATLAGDWVFLGGPNNAESAANAVIYPEEGIFVERKETSAIQLTLFGEVPVVSQASTVAGPASYFLSTRYPAGSPTGGGAGTPLSELGIENTSGWGSADRVYYWTGAGWQGLGTIAGGWFYIGGENNATSADNLIIPPNSALFVTRTSTASSSDAELSSPLPYTLE